MKSKFANSNNSGIKVAFKLPSGDKIDYLFLLSATVKVNMFLVSIVGQICYFIQDMYQFVLSNDVMPPFTLSVCHPLSSLPLDTMCDASVCDFENTLVMVRPCSGGDSFVDL